MAKIFPHKLLGLFGCVAVLVVIAGPLTSVSMRVRAEQSPAQSPPAAASTQSAAGEKPDAANSAKDQSKPYTEAEYRTFPKIGSRVAIWAVAQLHLLFAAFVLAVPLFAFITAITLAATKAARAHPGFPGVVCVRRWAERILGLCTSPASGFP